MYVCTGISGAERSDEKVEELLDMLLQLGVKPNEVSVNYLLESVCVCVYVFVFVCVVCV